MKKLLTHQSCYPRIFLISFLSSVFFSSVAYEDFGDIRFVKEEIPHLYMPGQLRTAQEAQECPLVDPDFGTTFSVQEAIEHAYNSRSSLKVKKTIVRERELEELVELSGCFPQVNLQTDWKKYKHFGDPSFTGEEFFEFTQFLSSYVNEPALLTAWQNFKGFTPQPDLSLFKTNTTTGKAQQLLLSFSGPYQRYYIAKENTAAARLDQERFQETIRSQVERDLLGYWNSIQKGPAASIREVSERDYFKREAAYNRVGFYDWPAWLERKTRLQKAYTDFDNYIYSRDSALTEFEYNGGILELVAAPNQSDIEQFIDTSFEQMALFTREYYVQQGLSLRKDLKIFDHDVARERLYADYYKRSYLPDLYFYMEATRGKIVVGNDSRLWFVGVELMVNFDGFANMNRADLSQAKATEYMLTKRCRRGDVRHDIEITYDAMQTAVKDVDALAEQKKEEFAKFEQKKKEYELGLIIRVDFERAQAQWNDFVALYDERRIQAVQKYRELLYQAGYPDVESL